MTDTRRQVATLARTAPAETVEAIATLLEFLNPPQQHYDQLSDEAARLLLRLPAGPSPERALVVFMQLFGRGYALWQSSYHYQLIHEYFYGAYLQALAEGGDALSPMHQRLFANFAQAMIAYTQCENAVISNSAQELAWCAARALAHANAALGALEQTDLPTPLRAPVAAYLRTNIALYRGFELCAMGYLHPETIVGATGGEPNPAYQAEMERLLAHLYSNSRELYSELRAHSTFVARYAQLWAQQHTSMYARRAEINLRSVGYLGEKLVAALFEHEVDSAEVAAKLVESARQVSGLPITAVRSAVLQDLFETWLGYAYLDQIIFDLDPKGGALTFTVYDGEHERHYEVETLQVRVARFGSISVEFGLIAEQASVSHLRVLESLIAPHAGRFQPVWRNSPKETTRARANYIDAYLKAQDWIARAEGAMGAMGTAGGAEGQRALDALRGAMAEWQRALAGLSDYFRAEAPDAATMETLLEETPEARRLRALYSTLRQCRASAREQAQAWLQVPANRALPEYRELAALAERDFSSSESFGYLSDIAEEIFERLTTFFATLLTDGSEQCVYLQVTDVKPSHDLRRILTYDPSTGWQAIISCDAFMVQPRGASAPGGVGTVIEADSRVLAEHPDFKGLLIQNREARASLDDWHFVMEPKVRNLATIRSHETDLMVLGQNRCLLYLPDDPQYLVAQYVASAAIVGDIRTIVLAFNMTAKTQIAELEAFVPSIQKRGASGLRSSRDALLENRAGIEEFRTNADQVLELLRSYAISKYQDHSELLRAMLQDSGVQDFMLSWERNRETLDHYHAYLTEVIQRKIGEREQSNQGFMTWLLLILSFLSGLSAIDPIATVLARVFGDTSRLLIEDVLYSAIGIFVVVGAILIWVRNRKV